jgi:RNA polymerase sigma-70 factor (ECF subfamily)
MMPIGRGDTDFEAELLSLYPQLKFFTRMLCRDRDKADDLTQSAYARAWRFRQSFISGADLRAWLFAVARRRFLSELRRERREAAWGAAAEANTDNLVDQSVWLELSQTLAAICYLTGLARMVLLLIGVGGFSYSEAATISNCSVGTVKSRLLRARRELSAMLEGRRGSDPKPGRNDRYAAAVLLAELDALASARTFDPNARARVERRLSQLQGRRGLGSTSRVTLPGRATSS